MAEVKGQIAFQQLGLAGVLRNYRLVVPPTHEPAQFDRGSGNGKGTIRSGLTTAAPGSG